MYSLMGLPNSVVIYCHDNSWNLHEYKGRELQELVIMSFRGTKIVLVASLTVPVCSFLFRAQSTLSSVSLRTKHRNCLGFLWLYVPVQDLVYSHFFSEDQVLKILLFAAVLSDSGLGLLSLCSRTKYQISHPVERPIPGAASLSAPKNSSHLFHQEYF